MMDLVWNENATLPIRKLTVFFSYRWVSSKEDYDRVLTALNTVLSMINTSLKEAQSTKLLQEQIKLPIVLDLMRAAYLHALQGARFGDDERILAKAKFDEQVDYLLQIKRPVTD